MSPYTPITYSYGFREPTLEELKALEIVGNRVQVALDEALKNAFDKFFGPPVTDGSLPQSIKFDHYDKPKIIPILAYGSRLNVNNQIPYSRHRSNRIYKKLLKRFGPQNNHLGIIACNAEA